MNLRKYFCFILISLTYWASNAQSDIRDSAIGIHLPTIHYSYQFPRGDLATRFGNNSAVGIDYLFKLKSQWEFGGGYQFLFGNHVKDTGMLSQIAINGRGIINDYGDFATFQVFERGHHMYVKGGRLFGNIGPNPNSGVFVHIGVGLLVHKVYIYNRSGDIAHFKVNKKEYLPGYDRYTSGVSLSQTIGYRYLANRGLINFFIAIEMIEGFTKLKRDYQVDYPINFENKTRNDILIGIKAGWILPLYKKPSGDYYFY